MMHIVMILVVLGTALGLRILDNVVNTGEPQAWQQRWRRALVCLMLPPLLFVTTALAVVWMGPQGEMLGHPTGWIGYGLAWGFLIWSLVLSIMLGIQAWRTSRQVHQWERINWQGVTARKIDSSALFCAQVGFWKPELVVSRGLIESLSPEAQQAVLIHEQAHATYQDTFWFFWLGWCRRLTQWLPRTEFFWQELLLLRELRADQQAAQQADPLVLAETLLLMAQEQLSAPEFTAGSELHYAAFSCMMPTPNRLTERVNALFAEPVTHTANPVWIIWTLGFALLPLITVPLHT
ncbi:MAG: M56 family metallopeptidase [Microcoleaceae cyanobacterium]